MELSLRAVTAAPPPPSTPSPPAAPTGLTATRGNGSIALAWTDPEDTSINGYEYRTKTSSATDWDGWQTITGATHTTTSHTISGLTNGTTYSVQIRARNAGGASGESNTDSATPTAPPTPPPTPEPPVPPPTPQCRLDVEAEPSAGGTVSDDWEGDCGTRRTATVTGVTDGYRFRGWSGGCSGTGACTVTVGTAGGMPTTVTVTANFALKTYTLSVTIDRCSGCGGSVSVSPAGSSHAHGTSITLTANLEDLTFLKSWQKTVGDDTTTQEGGETYTFTITGTTTVTAYIGDVCVEMPEVCALSREEDEGGEESSPP